VQQTVLPVTLTQNINKRHKTPSRDHYFPHQTILCETAIPAAKMPYSASTAFLEALLEAGVKYIYGNFGSDHPAILESLAEAKSTGRKMPEVITCPIEQVGLHVAMGYAHVLSLESITDCRLQGNHNVLWSMSRYPAHESFDIVRDTKSRWSNT
jgi:hypothetical protein